MNRFVIIRKGKKKTLKWGKILSRKITFLFENSYFQTGERQIGMSACKFFSNLEKAPILLFCEKLFFFLLKWISKTTACCTGFGYHPHKHNFLAIRGISADSHWLKTTTTPVGDNCCAMAAIKRVTAFILQEHFTFNTHLQLRSIKQIWMTVREKWME